MIYGVGTDIVEVKRFQAWENYSYKQFNRVFSDIELDYCGYNKNKLNLECLAVRFAAKEAFFKAFSAALVKLNITKNTFSFLFSCKHVCIVNKTWDVPQLVINWLAFKDKIGCNLPYCIQVNLSLSHEQKFAIAFVIISSR